MNIKSAIRSTFLLFALRLSAAEQPQIIAGHVKGRVKGKNYLARILIGYKPNGQNDYFNKTIHGASLNSAESSPRFCYG